MLSRAALVYDQDQDWVVEQIEVDPSVNLCELAIWNKEGQLKADELITETYSLDDVNEGYRAMREGENIRGVITYA